MPDFLFSQQIRSFENFVDGAKSVNSGSASLSSLDHQLATIATTYRTTAILDAGRRSLDAGRGVAILYEDETRPCIPTRLQLVE